MALTWLHLSDLHIRSQDPYDRNVILKALVQSVAWYMESGWAPDVIFFTGDVAHAGKAVEYEIATGFFDDLLVATGLDRRSLFVIPGNHDVARDRGVGLIRTIRSRDQADVFFDPDRTCYHIVDKQEAFARWHEQYFGSVRSFRTNTTCGDVEVVDVNGHRIAVLPINSALFCDGDDDQGKLWIGRRCLDAAVEQLRTIDDAVKIGLIHHPIHWLSEVERTNIQATLQENLDILLRGHLHENDVASVAASAGTMLHMAAGAVYQTSAWPNRALFARLDGEDVTVFPIRYEDRPQEVWTTDPAIFPRESGFQRTFPLKTSGRNGSRGGSGAPEPDSRPPTTSGGGTRFRHNIPSRRNLPFVGRDALLERIVLDLADTSSEYVMVLHGLPGVGKTELASEYARRYRERYPGGTFIIGAGTGGAEVELARIGENLLDLSFDPSLQLGDRCRQTLAAMGTAPTLLIYDGVESFDSLSALLPPAGMPCHVIITSVADFQDAGVLKYAVEPLSFDSSLELIEVLAGPEVVRIYGHDLAALADGLPVQICAMAMTLAYELRRGRTVRTPLALDLKARMSFGLVYEHLESDACLLLHAAAFLDCERIDREELERCLGDAVGWSNAEFERGLDVCCDLHLLQGTRQLRMHRLFAAFLMQTASRPLIAERLVSVRAEQRRRLVELACELEQSPTDSGIASLLVAFPLQPEKWSGVGIDIPIAESERIGYALSAIGRFRDALPWFRRVVSLREQSGRVEDRVAFGAGLHEVGYCLAGLGRFDDARTWFERAVHQKEQGDRDGSVDQVSLGESLHQVGQCFSSLACFHEALPWYERAVDAYQVGDRAGAVNNTLLAKSLHQIGYCYVELAELGQAKEWLRKAVRTVRKGDANGTVDQAQLGNSLYELGCVLQHMKEFRFAVACFKSAAAAIEQGDAFGRIAHDGLGDCYFQIASCHAQGRQNDDALSAAFAAFEAHKKGDIFGRVNHAGVGRCQHQIGTCYLNIETVDEALEWYRRAAESQERGDIHGRINYGNLAASQIRVASCLVTLHRCDEAIKWCRHVVDIAEKGEIPEKLRRERLRRCLQILSECYRRIGRVQEAAECDARAASLDC